MRLFRRLVLHYHGCNTDGNDIGRMVAAVLAGAKICDVADHGYGSVYGQAPALTLIQNLRDYGKKAVGMHIRPLLESSDILRQERKIYEPFESPFRGHDPTVSHYKLTGGAVGSAYEHADKGGFLERMPEILAEMARVQAELGNWWSVTPGSQILWTTAVNNFLYGRYEKPSLDLKNLILGHYGPLPFFEPEDEICEKVLEYQRADGKKWQQILEEEGGMRSPGRRTSSRKSRRWKAKLDRAVSDEDLCSISSSPLTPCHFSSSRTTTARPGCCRRRSGFGGAASRTASASPSQMNTACPTTSRSSQPGGKGPASHDAGGGPQLPDLQRPGGRPG